MAFVLFNLAAVAALVGIDQLIKLWASNVLQPVGAMPLIPPCAHAAPALWKHKRPASIQICFVKGRRSLDRGAPFFIAETR